MESNSEHTTPLSPVERIDALNDTAFKYLQEQGEDSIWRDRIGYFDSDSGRINYTIDEASQLHLNLTFDSGYGGGYSSVTSVDISTPEYGDTSLRSGFAWPDKQNWAAYFNKTEITDPQELENTITYTELVMEIFQTDIARSALRTTRKRQGEGAKALKDLRSFTKESELEISEDVYFRYTE